MGVVPLDWHEVVQVCESATHRVAGLIRSAPRADAPVPGLEWTVGEVAAHLVSLTTRYVPMVQDIATPAFDSMPELNAAEIAPLAGRSLSELADDLENGTAALLALCPSGDAPARFFDIESDCATAIALHVEELALHSVDIAKAIGAPQRLDRREALVAWAGFVHALPKFVDPAATRGRRLVFEFRMRGGPVINMTLADGTAVFGLGRVAKADCRVSADPATFLVAATGRSSQWRAAATGKALAYGRRPWLALNLRQYFVAA